MRQAKFCPAWSLSKLAWVWLLQTEEQYNNLLNTRAFIKASNQLVLEVELKEADIFKHYKITSIFFKCKIALAELIFCVAPENTITAIDRGFI